MTSAQKLLNIQGLRGLAIFGVFLYHLRPDVCPNGFLGVDIFFVISGFLMYQIFHDQHPVNSTKACNFYFRRIRRILPLYLGLITFVLYAASLFMYQLDFGTLFSESWRSLLFVANWPSDDKVEYSRMDENNYQFFKHLWSLSVEIQFYCLVPFMFAIFGYLGALFELVAIFAIVFSFLYQREARGDTEHMALSSRIWQFMMGFLAFKLHEFSKHYRDIADKNVICKFLLRSLAFLLTFILTVSLFPSLLSDKQLNRLLVLFIAMILILLDNFFLSSFYLIELGNISYSVYLIHWPLSQWHIYSHLPVYVKAGGLPQVETVVILATTSILAGFVAERFYNRVSGFLTSWKRLLFVVFGLYFVALEHMFYLKLNEGDVNIQSLMHSKATNNTQQVVDDLMRMWNDDFDDKINTAQAIYYNQQFHHLSWELITCPDPRRTSIPTRFDLENRVGVGNTENRVIGITGSCVVKGHGNKNFLVLGNSHAHAAFFGIERELRGIYKRLTLISAGACFLIKWRGEIPTPSQKTYDGCIRLIDNLSNILRAWKHPIDVIVLAHAYVYPYEIDPSSFYDNTPNSEHQQLSNLFETLSKYAREVVLVPQVQYHSGVVNHMSVLYRRILSAQSLDMFRKDYEKEHERAVQIKRLVSSALCSKCILLEWEDIWCDREKGLCDSLDHRRQISYFFDFNHVNAYGSLHVGRYIRQKYEEWLELHEY